jgi:hypothetical protein
VIVTGHLVRYLRREVKQEQAAVVTILQVEYDTVLDPETYRFDEGRSLFGVIGLTDEDEPADLELDLAPWPRLVLKTVESVYDAEVRRLQDAASEDRDLPMGDVPALGNLLAEVREKSGLRARRTHEQASPGEAT